MTINKEEIKNKIIYRASYRGTKEMDILMTAFVRSIINNIDENYLETLNDFVNIRQNGKIAMKLHNDDELVSVQPCNATDNFFLAIHTSYNNSGHLLNSLISELCDLRRNIVRSEPRKGDPYYTVVCEFRRHYLRKN